MEAIVDYIRTEKKKKVSNITCHMTDKKKYESYRRKLNKETDFVAYFDRNGTTEFAFKDANSTGNKYLMYGSSVLTISTLDTFEVNKQIIDMIIRGKINCNICDKALYSKSVCGLCFFVICDACMRDIIKDYPDACKHCKLLRVVCPKCSNYFFSGLDQTCISKQS